MKHDTNECIMLHCRPFHSTEFIQRSRPSDDETTGQEGTRSLSTDATMNAMNPENRMAQLEAGASPNIKAMSAITEGPILLTHVRK